MANIDSISLEAMNAYAKIANADVKKTETQNVDFNKIFEANFNKISGMSPQEIQSKLSLSSYEYSRSPAVRLDLGTHLSQSISDFRKVLVTQEVQAQKAALGKANLVDFLTATTEAKIAINSMKTLRDEMIKALNGVMNMTL